MLDDLTEAEGKALARCRYAVLGKDRPLRLDCGVELGPYRVAYQTYGTLNADKSNAILICHALTGDQFVAETHPVTAKEGWWESMVGVGNSQSLVKEIEQKRVAVPVKALASTPPCASARSK